MADFVDGLAEVSALRSVHLHVHGGVSDLAFHTGDILNKDINRSYQYTYKKQYIHKHGAVVA